MKSSLLFWTLLLIGMSVIALLGVVLLATP